MRLTGSWCLSVEPLGVRTVPLSKYLSDYDTDYDSEGNPYPGGLAILRHKGFQEIASQDNLKKLGQFAVQLFGYPYDKDEIAKIAARIAVSHLPFTPDAKKRILKRDREFICSEYVWESYHSLGVDIPHDGRGFISPANFAQDPDFQLKYVLQEKN